MAGYKHREMGCVPCNLQFDIGFSEEPSCPKCGSSDVCDLKPNGETPWFDEPRSTAEYLKLVRGW